MLLGSALALVLLARVIRGTARGREVAVLAALAIVLAAYVLSAVAIEADYRDADGYMDCWPSCTGLQELVRWGFWGGGLLVLLASALALVVILSARSRR